MRSEEWGDAVRPRCGPSVEGGGTPVVPEACVMGKDAGLQEEALEHPGGTQAEGKDFQWMGG